MTLHKVIFNPGKIEVEIESGKTVLDAARLANVRIIAPCGGHGTCKGCKVSIDNKTEFACKYIVERDLEVLVEELTNDSKILINEHLHVVTSSIGKLGLAIDLGTTTVVAELVDIDSGLPIAAAGIHNPQATFGADVISRISYCTSHKDGLEKLHKTIINCVNDLIAELCKRQNITIMHIKSIAAAGNTTMQHLFLGEDVESLGQNPFEPKIKNSVTVKAADLGINIWPQGDVYVNSPIAGHVGGDTLAVALVTKLAEKNEKALAIDIGTNGEILLSDGKEIFACSTAAGPALEGAKITFGSSGCMGAIENVKFQGGNLELKVIGDVQAKSICGSGLIDLLACLLDAGIMTNTGKFAKVENWPEILQHRNCKYDNHQAFNIFKNIVFTQKDIREAQLAIAAIKAGFTTLCKQASIDIAQLDKIYVAGAFGNYIDPKSAIRSGLLPKIDINKIEFIGNGSLNGARAVLVNPQERIKAEMLADKIKYVELASDMNFMTAYSEGMFFP
ncbi:MAG: DUF4445 domain-containing protein [Phycisphaerae bacterium]|nr:DUF4445 domain-containing protein [Phycisphaerae bacterium]